MRRMKSMLALVLALLTALLFCACSSGRGLSAPEGFDIDENNKLSWISVRNARLYRIEILSVESGEKEEGSTRKTYYSLDGLMEGDYEIRVMAVGGNQNETVSSWSEIINFHKDYESGLAYTLINNNTEYMISKVGTAEGNITIEDYYRGKPVTQIADAAFRASGRLESIVIGDMVTVIGDNAFYQCPRLVSVTVPDSVVSIGVSAFQGCSLLSDIVLPSGLVSIADNTFAYCRSLEHIELGEELQSIGDSAFYACSALKEIAFPDSLQTIGAYAFSTSSDSALTSAEFGGGLETIGQYAFYGCKQLASVTFEKTETLTIEQYAFANCDALTEVALPSGLVTIGNQAFYSAASLSNVTIPDTVKSVGRSAFNGTALYIAQEESGEYDGFIYADKWLVATTVEGRKNLPEALNANSEVFKEGIVGFAAYALNESPTLRNLTLPSTVKYLGDYALANNPELYQLITSPNSLLEIGYRTFANCGNLSNIRFGDGLKSIGAQAFYNCTSVGNNQSTPELLVPKSVEHIGQSAFSGTDLSKRPDANGVIYAGKWVVGYNTLTTSEIELDPNVKGIADYAFFNCKDLRSVSGINKAEHIGEAAFALCSNLTYISNLNKRLEKIEPMTFYGCGSLFGVGFPTELKEIGMGAFARCGDLSEIDLTDTVVETIGDLAFYGCSNVKEIHLGDQLKTIGEYAFYLCDQVTELVLPDTLREIGERAFAWCLSIETLDFGEGLETIGDFAFRDCYALTSIVLPDSLKEIGDYAFYRCIGVTELDLGQSVERIGMCAFYGLNGVTALELPASLEYVGDYAFIYCSTLRSVVMQGEIGYVGAHAFYGCDFMTAYASFKRSVSAPWSEMWNSSYRPVIWGCTLSEDGYVAAVTLGEMSNAHAWFGIGSPVRKGYTFVGWTTDPYATTPEFKSSDLKDLESGTTLYAIWEGKADENPNETPNETPEAAPVVGGFHEPIAPVEDIPDNIREALDKYFQTINE